MRAAGTMVCGPFGVNLTMDSVLPPPAIRAAISSGTAAKTMVSPVATANLVMITDERRTGVASRWMTLPSSISAPSTLDPIIRAVSGSSTEKPNVPSTCEGQGRDGGWLAFRTRVTAIRMTAGSANSSARLRPRMARIVIRATVGLNKDDTRAPSVRDEVGEDAFQGFVGGLHLAQPDASFPG